jgi:hypothetical protein
MMASSITYPLETARRRMQLNGTTGHKNIYRNDFDCFKRMLKDEGYRGLYKGFGVNLAICIPMVFI